MASQWPAFSLNGSYIHIGAWTNWNDDYSNGGRITVTKEAADLIMIFIGILFVFMESGLCSLVTFALFWFHVYRRPYRPVPAGAAITAVGVPASASAFTSGLSRSGKPRDAVWHQRQTMLRNSGDFLTITGRLVSLWLAYRRIKSHLSSRVLRTAILSLLTAGLFLVALPFLTTFVVLHEKGNQVLIKSSGCGLFDTNTTETRRADAAHRWRMAIQYADVCYETMSPSELCDNYFINRTLASAMDDAACPFDRALCLGDGRSPAITITVTGIDSHTHLGLNAQHSDRIQFDKTATCVPLNIEDHHAENDTWMDVRLGSIFGDGTSTFSGYKGSQTYFHGFQSSLGWDPIPELSDNENGTSLVILHNPGMLTKSSNGGGPVKDPFFYSDVPSGEVNDPDWFLAPKVLTAIGCVEHYAFRNPDKPHLSSFNSSVLVWSGGTVEERTELIEKETDLIAGKLELNQKQKATLQLAIWSLAGAGPIGRMVGTVGISALRAVKDPGIYQRTQNPLPDDQWKKEVQYWVNIGLAALQQEFVRFAAGPLNNDGLVPGPRVAKDGVCDMQKIKQTDFKNFRRPGFIALAAIGGFLIVVPWVIIKLVIGLGKRRQWLFVLEWISYSEQQLLRMANEGAGVQGWQGCDEDVPFIDADEIAHVDLGDVKHPQMGHLSTEMDRAAGRESTNYSSTTRLLG